jgi:hypothetical protein
MMKKRNNQCVVVEKPMISNQTPNSYRLITGKILAEMKYQKIVYGNASPDQFFNLYQPIVNDSVSTFLSTSDKKFPVMFLIHGGFWKQCYNLNNSLSDGLVGFFQKEGYYVVHLEYRRGNKTADDGDGGWPETNTDVILAMNKLEDLVQNGKDDRVCDSDTSDELGCTRMDLENVVVIGHSAGENALLPLFLFFFSQFLSLSCTRIDPGSVGLLSRNVSSCS